MAQKSLSILNKVDTSMIWYSTFFDNNYRWLSTQYLYFTNFLLKLILFLDFFFDNIIWVEFEKQKLLVNYVDRRKFLKFKSKKYTTSVATYIISISNKLLLINLYYLGNLKRLQDSVENNKQIKISNLNVNNCELEIYGENLDLIEQLEFLYECT